MLGELRYPLQMITCIAVTIPAATGASDRDPALKLQKQVRPRGQGLKRSPRAREFSSVVESATHDTCTHKVLVDTLSPLMRRHAHHVVWCMRRCGGRHAAIFLRQLQAASMLLWEIDRWLGQRIPPIKPPQQVCQHTARRAGT